MTDAAHNSESISLWDSLHDGYLQEIAVDSTSKTLTLVIDAPSRWEFYRLPSETRVRIIAEEDRMEDPFKFEVDEDYVILNANLAFVGKTAIVRLEVYSYPNSNYSEVLVTASSLRFLIGERELSLEEFQEFSSAYWKRSDAKNEVSGTQ